jgi:maltose/moltooligosaccharide transporter
MLTSTNAINIKPKLTFWQIWNMSFGFLGIQFGFALQNSNVSRIFETLGANIDDIPILWVAAPVTGLIVQPIIGYYSDRTWNKLGRRRPYFLVGAILASAALFIMPNSPTLWFAAGMLWILDASINISMEPFRAFVGDNLSEDQRTTGFAMQSFFIGTGAVVASMLPFIVTQFFGVSNVSDSPGGIPPSVKLSFYIGGMIFLLAVLWTVFKSFEYSPQQLESFERAKIHSSKGTDVKEVNYLPFAIVSLVLGAAGTYGVAYWELKKELFIFTVGTLMMGIIILTAHFLKNIRHSKLALVDLVDDLFQMPKTMKQLAVVQFFSWFALFSMWIYTTAAVTKTIYGAEDTNSSLYNDGADWVGVCFAVYSGVAALFAFFLPVLAKKTSRIQTHAISLVMGALGLISIYFIKAPEFLLVSMIGVGIAWASILAMPYAILTGSLPASKMGYFMGVFNFFIVIPQIVAASILGFLIAEFFDSQAIYALLIGGFSLIIAALFTLKVQDQ